MWWIEKLKRAAGSPERYVVGLMSGTSMDGVDAVLCRISARRGKEPRFDVVSQCSHPYPRSIERALSRPQDLRVPQLAELDIACAEVFAAAARNVVKRSRGGKGVVPYLIGSHGQTIYHHSGLPKTRRATMQIGDGDVIAARTGIAVVSDFRMKDIALGGEGAPLTPYADWLLFRALDERRTVVINLGGIANITVLNSDPRRILGFDVGPANAPLDRLARIRSGGKLKFDRDGKLARRGSVNSLLLRDLLRGDLYIRRRPPKSTGTEVYGDAFVDMLLKKTGRRAMDDLIATVVEFIAETLRHAIKAHLKLSLNSLQVVLAGGGVRNPYLVERIRSKLEPADVVTADQVGVPPQAREALSFALFADEVVRGKAVTYPAITGIERPALLGKLSLPD